MEKVIKPTFYPELEEYSMRMHTDAGAKFHFVLTGLKLFHPNMGSRCGYGSDDWFFHCRFGGEDYLLCFSDDAGYGTAWDCAVISKEDAGKLHSLCDAQWNGLRIQSEARTHHLHPDSIAAAKEIVNATSSRTGPITDQRFYGL